MWLTAYCQEVRWEKERCFKSSWIWQQTFAENKLLSVQIDTKCLGYVTNLTLRRKMILGMIHTRKKEGRRVSFPCIIPIASFLPLSHVSPILAQMKIICIMKGYKIYFIGGEGIRNFLSLRAWRREETEQRWEQETIKCNYAAQINLLNSCTVK